MDPLEPGVIGFLERRHGQGVAARAERASLSACQHDARAVVERVTIANAGEQTASYVIKRLHPLRDWVGRSTSDERLREYQLLSAGIYRALPHDITSMVAGGVEIGERGVALIMHDVAGGDLPDTETPLSEGQVARALRALAHLHSTFFGFPARLTAGLGLCTVGHWLTLFTPSPGRSTRDADRDAVITQDIAAGWASFSELAPDAWAVLEPLLADPAPVVRALRGCPDTIVHGNAVASNLGFTRDQVVLLDWSQTLRGPGALDLAWFVAANATRSPIAHDTAIDMYRMERDRAGRLPAAGERWERELNVALLGGAMRIGWRLALDATHDDESVRARAEWELGYWTDIAVGAKRWL